MAIEVEITVVTIDRERGVKATRQESVEVSGKTMKLYELLGGNEDDVLRRVGDTVFASALREVKASRVDLGSALTSAGGGRIGGRGGARPAEPEEVSESAPTPTRNQVAPDLGSMLGLDIIRNQVSRERGSVAPATRPGAPMPQRRQSGPGPVGFPKR